MISFLTELRNRGVVASVVPKPVRQFAHRISGGIRSDAGLWRAEYEKVLNSAKRVPRKHDLKIGVIRDIMLKHSYYEAACLELGVPYEALDILESDWMQRVAGSGCDAFVARPYVLDRIGKSAYDVRLRIMEEDMGLTLFPSAKSLWLYESKWRNAEWLAANGVPQPRTRIFFEREEAENFFESADLPVVFKTDVGSESLGVVVVKSRHQGIRLIKKCFGRGYLAERQEPRDRQWGYVIFQDYVPAVREWRVVRIGNSFFGHRKGIKDGFFSGSKIIEYDDPPRELLDFCRLFLDKGSFDNMAVDVLEDDNGNYCVIEMHAYFGCNHPDVMEVNGRPGRYLFQPGKDAYEFEEGHFNRNASCNLRLEWFIHKLGERAGKDTQCHRREKGADS